MIPFPTASFQRLRHNISEERRSLAADIVLLIVTCGIIYILARVGAGMFQAFNPPEIEPSIELDPKLLPYYAARSTIRMFIALGFALTFTLIYGYLAVQSKFAAQIMVPLLDVLQSVPVLGFLSATVTGFIALFPGSLLGLECASIFAIFTSQVWNLTFSFYFSLSSLPHELEQAAKIFRLNRWQRFCKLELPSALIGLVWNGMMSFSGGWFFVSVSEAISVLNKSYTLPGIGSFVAKAIAEKNLAALGWAMLAMAVVIVLVDQFFWKPLVAWSDRFKLEVSSSQTPPYSWFYELLKSSHLPQTMRRLSTLVSRKLNHAACNEKLARKISFVAMRRKLRGRNFAWGMALGIVVCLTALELCNFVTSFIDISEIWRCFLLGLHTLARVIFVVTIATIIWTPVGVAIGFHPRLARVAQPIVQFLSSFPANFLFPLVTIVLIRAEISLGWGSFVLMALGAQWYILFNVIAGSISVPSDLREMASNLRLTRWQLWQKLIIPAIFPSWVTGALTASGGAWNASIVSEIVTWGDITLSAEGLGAYISRATQAGDWPHIVLGVSMMSIFVVSFNRVMWHRLYRLAATRYRLG